MAKSVSWIAVNFDLESCELIFSIFVESSVNAHIFTAPWRGSTIRR